ncbi:Cytochrome C oxidase, cbb3-type, subunit III [Cyclobacterium lianum]|uniref:Cytochrome C oxidase, cbb3-type, subunit III n=2 Tax=Cyclobacterium lianum TaxID=388280 RepID=A0A1M7NYI9_9BACT|nr:Cytochrome C oxidase, cbb3-type, subunit III [Cyclobacterium lianum]
MAAASQKNKQKVPEGMIENAFSPKPLLKDPVSGQESIKEFVNTKIKQMKIKFTICCIPLMVLTILSCNKSDNQNALPDTSEAEFILQRADLPDYEQNIDHKALLQALGDRHGESMRTGEHIYSNTCVTCHGNMEEEGSLPTAFKFWSGAFKVGNDPYSIYQTLTRGHGAMPPQVNLTPVEKYDVIHYIRETFVAKENPDQYFEINEAYLAGLPAGTSMGPEPREYKPWAEVDYGNFLINTYELVDEDAPPRERSTGPVQPLPDEDFSEANFAYKGIAVRLDQGPGGVAAGRAWMMFDHDLMRMAGAWTGKGFIDWEAILFNEKHNISPRTIGKLHVENETGPGWAHPETGSFEDPRFQARDGRKFGPLPRDWAHFEGMYPFKDQLIMKYTVGKASILETFGLDSLDKQPVFTRTLNVIPAGGLLKMRVAKSETAVALTGEGASLTEENGYQVVSITSSSPVSIKIFLANAGVTGLQQWVRSRTPPASLEKFTRGGPARFPQVLKTNIIPGEQEGAFQVDILNPPFNSPWKNQLRLSGLDFFRDRNKAVVCAADGDVWLVEGFTENEQQLSWQRIASGLFQPLGIKVIDEEVFVTCRDQIVRLHDYNGDNEADFYESFNNDHQVTDHFHEFAMGLQADATGNLYYAKSARHAREALVPQHGTLIRVSPDGKKSSIIATGFRAANGVCLNPDGSFIVTDQEGHWNPMNRINWVEEGGFYGNMFGFDPPADSTDAGMEQPLVWVERERDRSPSELLWVDSEKWGPLNGKLLSFSYGYGKVYLVPFEEVDGQVQGGIVELPLPRFATGVMRGRFNPEDGHLYLCGLSAWGSTQPQLGGLYRIRMTDKPLHVPVGIEAQQDGVLLTFTEQLDEITARSADNYQVATWDLLRSRKYGSKHYNEQELQISEVELGSDGKSVKLKIPGIEPTWVMEINYQLKSGEGASLEGVVQNTIHQLGNVPS